MITCLGGVAGNQIVAPYPYTTEAPQTPPAEGHLADDMTSDPAYRVVVLSNHGIG